VSTQPSLMSQILSRIPGLRPQGDRFVATLPIDPTDRLSAAQLQTITQAKDPYAALYDILDKFMMDCQEDESLALLHEIREVCDDLDDAQSTSLDPLTLYEWIAKEVDFEGNYDHYLNQSVCVNLLINTGDGDTDFGLNNFVGYYADPPRYPIDERSSLLWLIRQQGYTKRQLNHALRASHPSASPFLQSILMECQNTTSSMNALTFFVRMPLRDLLDWYAKPHPITLSAHTACGLYDPWNGAGGSLEIQLAQNLTIPAKYLEPHIDGTRGYGIQDTYGLNSTFWTDTILPTPPRARHALSRAAQTPA